MITNISNTLEKAAIMLDCHGIKNSDTHQYTEVSMPDHMYDRYIELPHNQTVNPNWIPEECEVVYCIFVPAGEDHESGERYDVIYSREEPDPAINYDFFKAKIFVKKDHH